MNQRPSLAINTLSNFFRYAVEMVVLFILTSKTVRTVGVDQFGLWSLIFSVVGFFTLLDFGLMTGTVKYVSECRGSGNIDRRNRIVSSLFFVYILLSLAALAGLLAFSFFFNSIFSIPEEQKNESLWLFWIVAFRAVVLNLPLSLFMGLLFGEQRIALINLFKSASAVLYGVVGWATLTKGYGIVGLAWINLAAMLIEHACYVFFSYRFLQNLHISWKLADRSAFAEIASFSMYQFIVNISTLVLTRSDPIIIKIFMPLSAVAVYSAALKIAENVRLLVKQTINALTPLIGELHGAGETEKIRLILLYGTKYAFALVVFLSVPICLFGKDIIRIWVGDSFLDAFPVVCILCGVMILTIPQLTASNILAMTGRHRYTAWASVCSIGINIGVTVVLIQFWGLVGVALGTLAATLAVDIFMIVNKACRELHLAYRDYMRMAILPALAPALGQAALAMLFQWIYPAPGLGMLVVVNIPGALVFGLVFYRFHLQDDEKNRLVRQFPFLNRLLRKFFPLAGREPGTS